MTLAWIVPALIAAAGTVVAAVLARQAADEAAGLRRTLTRFGELQPALVEVRELSSSAAESARRISASR